MSRGRHALARLYKGVKDVDLDRQWEVLVLTVEHEREYERSIGGGGWLDIFKGVDGRRTFVCAWTITGAQFLGLNILNSYSSYFYSNIGLKNPFELTAINKGPQIILGIIIACVIDRVGRRNILCGFMTLMWFSDLGIAVIGSVGTHRKGAIAGLVFCGSVFCESFNCEI